MSINKTKEKKLMSQKLEEIKKVFYGLTLEQVYTLLLSTLLMVDKISCSLVKSKEGDFMSFFNEVLTNHNNEKYRKGPLQ